MTTSIDLDRDNDMQAHARASHRGQSPGFQRIRIGITNCEANSASWSVQPPILGEPGE